ERYRDVGHQMDRARPVIACPGANVARQPGDRGAAGAIAEGGVPGAVLGEQRRHVVIAAIIEPEAILRQHLANGVLLLKRARHVSGRTLYVASSDSASGIGGVVGTKHHVTALRVDPTSGALSPHGEPIALPTRPIHMTLDIPSEHILVAFSNPSGLQAYRVNPDMTPGAQVAQPEPIDPGIYGHQVRVSLDNKKVILVTRGHDAAGGKPEEPGALKVFDYAAGVLTNETSIAPNGGYGLGPRHLDFHPTKPWVYVPLERQNRLVTFAFDMGALSAE